MEPGGKLVLWGMDNCDINFPLIITEGEMDALTLDECGIPNVVSLPNGVNGLDCIDLLNIIISGLIMMNRELNAVWS